MTRINPHRPIAANTIVWQRSQGGRWEKYLVREQPHTSHHLSKLVSVDSSLPVCLACLSNDVVVFECAEFLDGALQCHSCGVSYGILM